MMRPLLLIAAALTSDAAEQCGVYTDCKRCMQVTDADRLSLCSWCNIRRNCVPNSFDDISQCGNRIQRQTECPNETEERQISNEYNETHAKLLLYASFSSYGKDPKLCLNTNNMTKNIVITKKVLAGKFPETYFGYTALSLNEKAIILAFRGTVSAVQFAMEIVDVLFKDRTKVSKRGAVVTYFYKAFHQVWNEGLLAEVKRLQLENPSFELWITGHSMGAAMAVIAATEVVSADLFPKHRIKVVTFGEPRVGNWQFANNFDDMIEYKFRVTHNRDLVPHMPPQLFYRYRHHRHEVWYNSTMTSTPNKPVICQAQEDNNCSNSNFIMLSFYDHEHYFGDNFRNYVGDSCKEL